MSSCSLMFLILCGIGLIIQVATMSQLYFSYKITSSISVSIPTILNPEATSLCASYLDVLDYKRLNGETGRNWSYSGDFQESHKYQDDMTISEIFRYTPHEKEILAGVMFRHPNSSQLLKIRGKESYEHFNVSKYIYLEQVCYMIGPRHGIAKPYNFYAVTPYLPGTVYGICLQNNTIMMSEMIRILNHRPDAFPYRSLRATPVIVRKTGLRSHTDLNLFISNQVRLQTLLLPPPYETDCFDYHSVGLGSEEHCLQACVAKIVHREFGKVPFSVIITESSSRQIVSYNDVMNEMFARKILQIEQECGMQVCARRHCDMRMAISNTMSSAEDDASLRLVFVVPSHPSFRTTTHAKMDMVEFLTYIMSTLGIWSGLNFMTFEPTKVSRFLHRKMQRLRPSPEVKASPQETLRNKE